MSAARQGWFSIATLLAILSLAGSPPAARAASGPATVLHFNIPAGKLVDRMTTFAIQSEVQVLYKFDGTESITTRAVLGDFTPGQALERMLEGTGIVPEFVKPQTVALKRRPGFQADRDIGTGRGWVRNNQRSWAPTDRRGTQNRDDGTTVVISAERPLGPAVLGEPLLNFSHREIEETGAATVPEFVRTMPQVFGGGASEDTHDFGMEARSNSARGSGINVRGLDAGASLVLVNGHRLAVGGATGRFVDVSSLPLLAVERLEISPASFSTRYGADAVGGTINVILRNHFDGALTSGRFGTTTKSDLTESSASQLFGAATDTGSGLLAIDYYTRDSLEADRRPLVTSHLTPFGGTNFDQPFSNPGTILGGGTTWAIPRGQDGSHLDPRTLQPATQNLTDRWDGADVLPRQQRWSAFGTWKNELTDSVSVFSDVLATQREVRGASAPATGNLIVPATNAFYVSPVPGAPFVAVAYNFGKDLGPIIGDANVKTHNLAAGLDWDFAPLWHLVGTTTYASERLGLDLLNSVDLGALNAALADRDRSTALNVFGDGTHTNPATLEKLRTTSSFSSRSYLKALNLTANGPVMSTPAGSLWLTAGTDYRTEAFSSTTRLTPLAQPVVAASERTVTSLFAEAQIPFWDKDNRRRGLERLAVSAGARYENYSDFGSEITPHYGIEWSPVRGVSLRGSWARSFRPPTLIDKDESNNAWSLTALPDPSAPGGRVVSLVWGGNNADLKQETARSWTAGLDFKPSWAPHLSLATTYFDIHFNDRLDLPTLGADVLVNPLSSHLVIRHPTAEQVAEVCRRAPIIPFAGTCGGPVGAIVDARLRNDVYMHTRGYDVLAKYMRDTSYGTLSLSLAGTYIIDFAVAESPELPLQDLVSTQNYPIDLRLRSSIGWSRGSLTAIAYVNYADHYRDTASVPQRRVSSSTTMDMNLAYTFAEAHGGWLGETVVSLSAQNVFDRNPPFLNNSLGVGYDQENADIIGRFVSFTIRQKW